MRDIRSCLLPAPLRRILQTEWGAVWLVYAAFVVARFVLAIWFAYPMILTDELIYKNMAQSFFSTGSFTARWSGWCIDLPSVLYPFLIAPAFAAGPHALVVVKLINSALMNAAIFPIYWTARQWTERGRSLAVAALSLGMVAFTYTAFLMTEVVIFPLYWFCFAMAIRALVKQEWRFALLLGLGSALFLMSKPNPIVFLFMVAVMIGLLRTTRGWRRFALPASMWIVFGFTLASVNTVLHGSPLYNLGYYHNFTGIAMRETNVDWRAAGGLALVMVVGILFLYGAPALVSLRAALSRGAERGPPRATGLGMGLAAIALMVLFVLKFSADIAPSEHWMRVNARYYWMTLPILLIGFVAFFDRQPASARWLITLSLAPLSAGVAGLCWLFPRYIRDCTRIDNPDYTWFFEKGPAALVVVGLLLIAGVLTARWIRPRWAPFVSVLAVVLVWANFAQYRSAKIWVQANISWYLASEAFVRNHVPPNAARVAVAGSRYDHFMAAFALPFRVCFGKAPENDGVDGSKWAEWADYGIVYGNIAVSGLPEHRREFICDAAPVRVIILAPDRTSAICPQ
jgi:hypothetical protein